MHPNGALLNRLFQALDQHDHAAMAACYDSTATFRDIAFELVGSTQIRGMWQMICDSDIRVTWEVIEADEHKGRVKLVDTYHFGASKDPPKEGRLVTNAIESRFLFKGGLITRQHDFCDARAWARAALGGPIGFLAGRLRFLRSWKANQKLEAFLEMHSGKDSARRAVRTS